MPIDPAWLTNVILVLGGYIVKVALKELKDMRADLDDIKLLVASKYITKEESAEQARNIFKAEQSEALNRWMEHFVQRNEIEILEERFKELKEKVKED